MATHEICICDLFIYLIQLCVCKIEFALLNVGLVGHRKLIINKLLLVNDLITYFFTIQLLIWIFIIWTFFETSGYFCPPQLTTPLRIANFFFQESKPPHSFGLGWREMKYFVNIFRTALVALINALLYYIKW